MASSKVTLLIDTKFQNFEELIRKGKDLQAALGVGKIAAEYAALDTTLGNILQKINQLKGGGAGGSSTPVITAGHGAKGSGSAAAITSLQQNVIGAATAAAAGAPAGMVGVRAAAAGVAPSYATHQVGKAMMGGFGQFHTTRATVKGIVRDQMAPSPLRGAAYNASHAFYQAAFGNEVYEGYQERRYASARPLHDPYVAAMAGDRRPAYASPIGAAPGATSAAAQSIRNRREQLNIRRRMERQAAEAERLGAMEDDYLTGYLATSQAKAETRLNNMVRGQMAPRDPMALDAQRRGAPILGAGLARGLRSAQASRARLSAARIRTASFAGLGFAAGMSQIGTGVLSGTASPVMGGFGGMVGGGLGFMLGGPLGGAAGAALGGGLGGFLGSGADRAVSMATSALQFQRQASAFGAIGGGGGIPSAVVSSTIGGVTKTAETVDIPYPIDESRGGPLPGDSVEAQRVKRSVFIRGAAATRLGFSGSEALGAYTQATLAGMGSPKNAQDLRRVLELQRSYAVDPRTSGQILFGLMRTRRRGSTLETAGAVGPDSTMGARSGALTALTDELTMGGRISALEQRSLFQMAGRIFGPRFAETGISPTATMDNVSRFLNRSGAGFRSQQFAEGGVAYGTRLAAQGPRSPFDFALLSQMTGGGGVSPEGLVGAYTRLEEGGALNPQLLKRMLSMTEAAGGGRGTGLSKLLINREMLRKFIPGLGLSRTDDAIRMIRDGVPMDEIRGALSVGEQGIGVGISERASQLTTKQMQKETQLKNEMLRLGTEMIDTMQVFKEAAEQMAKNFKEVAPVMAEMNRRIADFSRFVLGGDS